MFSSLKIAQVVCVYPPYRSGMGQVAFEYTERLRALGHDVHVFTIRSKHDPINDLASIHRLPSLFRIGNAGVIPSLFFRLSSFDLVHLHYPFFGGAEFVALRKCLHPKQKLVMTYHMDAVSSGFRGFIFHLYQKWLLPFLVKQSDRILVSSEDYFKNSALALIPLAEHRTEIHPFGVDLERFYPGKDNALRLRHEMKQEEMVLLFVGALDRAHEFKGLDMLLEAVAQLSQKHWRLVVVGEGDLRSRYENLAEKSGLRERVLFLGNVAENAKPRYYRMADIHVFPSTSRAEAFGVVALEAAASGIPTIASDLPGVRTVVSNQKTGLLVKPNDVHDLTQALETLMTQSVLRNGLGLSARVHAKEHFAWPSLMEKLEKMYFSIETSEKWMDFR